MSVVTNQKLGGTGTVMGIGDGSAIRPYRVVLDIAEAVATESAAGGSFVAGDQIDIMTIPDGAYFAGIDAEITEALVLGSANGIDIGTTTADPDEYVDAQTDTAVGRFSSYVSAAVTPAINVGEKTLTMEVNGDGITSGKVAVTVWLGFPVTTNKERAAPREYPIS